MGEKVFERLVQLGPSGKNEALIQGLTAEQLLIFSTVLDKLESNAQALLAAEQECKGEAEGEPLETAKGRASA